MISLDTEGLENGEKMNFHISVGKKKSEFIGLVAGLIQVLYLLNLENISHGVSRLKDYKYFTNIYFD